MASGSPSPGSLRLFTSKIAIEKGIKEKYGLQRQVLPVSKTRDLGKQHMVRNNRTGTITIDPETHKVTLDGREITSQPAKTLPLTQLYYLF